MAMKKKGYRNGGKVKTKGMRNGGRVKAKGMRNGGRVKAKGMRNGGKATNSKKTMMTKKGSRAGGAKKMTVAQLRSAAKKMGYKVTKA
tara:strand:- start:1424 stop:1687 length:264 start_codon:yes stop_codon:yes gene_type:complete